MLDELIELLKRLQSCRRLINISPTPVRLPCGVGSVGMTTVLRLACETFGIRELDTADRGEIRDPSGLERVVWRRLNWNSTPLVRARVSESDARAAVARVDREDPRRRFERHSIRSARGAQLEIYERGPRDRSAWVLVLPYGIPADMAFDLANEIAGQHRFITFEGPDLLSDPDGFDACAHGIDESANDILAVMNYFELPRAHIAGLCAGVMPSLRFAHLHGSRVASLILGNGSYRAKSSSPLDFIALAQSVGGQRKKAQVFFKWMSARDLTSVEPELPHFTMIPYSNPDLLYMFTTAFRSFYDRDLETELDTWIRAVDQPALVVAGERDRIVSPEGSRTVASKLKRSRILLDPEGTHLSLLHSPKQWMMEAMLQFCRENDADIPLVENDRRI